MSFAITTKTKKLLTVLNGSGYAFLEDLAKASLADTVCPAICMQENCDHIEELEKDQTEGWCEECQSNTMTSVLVLADLI